MDGSDKELKCTEPVLLNVTLNLVDQDVNVIMNQTPHFSLKSV